MQIKASKQVPISLGQDAPHQTPILIKPSTARAYIRCWGDQAKIRSRTKFNGVDFKDLIGFLEQCIHQAASHPAK